MKRLVWVVQFCALLLTLNGIFVGVSSIHSPTAEYVVTIRVLDSSLQHRPVASARVTITTRYSPTTATYTTSDTGEIVVRLAEGGYTITAACPVRLYGKPASEITASAIVFLPSSSLLVELFLPIYDVTVKLIMPNGSPVVGADIAVGGVALGKTDAEGNVLAASIPFGDFSVAASWFGLDISPTSPLSVTGSGTFTMTASKIARIQVQVVGALNQGLAQANVIVRIGATTVFTGATGDDGALSLELPYGTYYITALYQGIEATKTVSLIGDTTEKMETGIFIVLLGQPLTLVGFAFWAVIVLVLLLAVGFLVLRRRRKVSLPPPPPP